MTINLMRSAPGWSLYLSVGGDTFVFQNKDAFLAIFAAGNWECSVPNGTVIETSWGTPEGLEKFLNDFAKTNSDDTGLAKLQSVEK